MGRMRDLLSWLEASMTEEEALALWEEVMTQYLDPKKVDLVAEYQKLNKLLFDGKLGVYPMKWNKRKRSGALVHYRRMGQKPARKGSRMYSILAKTGSQLPELKILSVEVSTFMSFNEQALRNRLAHEMIHVYWLEQGVEYGHDEHFKSEMRRINRMNVGITVSTTESYQDPNVQLKKNDYGVFVGIQNGNPRSIMVVPVQNINKMIDFLSMLMVKFKFQSIIDSYEVYRHDAEFLNQYPQSRIPKRAKFPSRYQLDKDEGVEIKTNGKYMGILTSGGFSKSDARSVEKAIQKPKEPERVLVFVQRRGRVAEGVFTVKEDAIRTALSSLIATLSQGSDYPDDMTWEAFVSDADWAKKIGRAISFRGVVPELTRIRPLQLGELHKGEYKGILHSDGKWVPGGKPKFA